MTLKQGRHPTHDEVEELIARARQLRAQCVAALIARAVSRLTQLSAEARHGTHPRRLRADMS